MINRLTIIGVGLIGGSLARALRQAGAVGEIIGCSRDESHLQKAVELGVIDRYSTDLREAVSGVDVVVFGTPVGSLPALLEKLGDALDGSQIVSDVGSTKGSVVAAIESVYGECPEWFVPGHPIAGTERNGVEASFAELYQNRRVILTPLPNSRDDAVETLRWMWQQAGATVETMEPKHHDEVFAATSHLPHVLAYSLVDTLATMDEKVEIFRYAAGGFRDFTRIASSDPTMWHDICLANSDAIMQVLDRFESDLAQLRKAMADGDGDYLKRVFERAKEARDRFCDGVE